MMSVIVRASVCVHVSVSEWHLREFASCFYCSHTKSFHSFTQPAPAAAVRLSAQSFSAFKRTRKLIKLFSLLFCSTIVDAIAAAAATAAVT